MKSPLNEYTIIILKEMINLGMHADVLELIEELEK